MKKTTLGCFLFLAGMLSTALLLSGSMSSDLTINGPNFVLENLICIRSDPRFLSFYDYSRCRPCDGHHRVDR